jgi:hypothetical protein
VAPTTHHDPRPFLTIVAWPDAYDRRQLAQLLADCSGLDPTDLRYRLGQPPPMILAQIEADIAQRAVAALTQRGGDAFTVTLDDLATLGPTLKIKDMRVNSAGNLDVDLWEGLSTTIRRAHVQILVRAHLKTTVKGPPREIRMDSMTASEPMARRALAEGARPTRSLKTSDKLDIHTTDGSVYQVDGDHFAFQILGDLKGYSGKANMDHLCELLSHLAPDEVVDEYFNIWRAPPRYDQLRLPESRPSGDDPAFAFYSRWAALMYRHVMG